MDSVDHSVAAGENQRARVRVQIRGAVQGVGFRPFICRLARELHVGGWVRNSSAGIVIEAEACREELQTFLRRLEQEKPVQSVLQSIDCRWLASVGYEGFQIRASDEQGSKTALVLPDLATCEDCRQEIFDPNNRRFHYPFTNCTHCGPRFTIIEGLPYDRVRTSMKGFLMCPDCQAEYDDPNDRRFHAQPNACPACGPRLELWDRRGHLLSAEDKALTETAAALRAGQIVAVKGLGGFHLLVAAHWTESVGRLRQAKHRAAKPFALLFPSLKSVLSECELSGLEHALLCSPQAPIVLLRRQSKIQNPKSRISPAVAPGNPSLGVMIPSTPLHHLLLDLLGFPVVATSGNLAEEPICIEEQEALERLGAIADLFLVHNRPIVRHVDDSIVRVMVGREMILRRARGYAPLPISLGAAAEEGGATGREPTVLAVGAHLKNTTALAIGQNVFLSQHIGDLETPQAYAAFTRVIADFQAFYGERPTCIAADAHPDYLSTRFARQTGSPVLLVQHHYAHVLSCMAEHGLEDGVLGVSWDGTGLGSDGTIWGGEFLTVTKTGFTRCAHWRTFRLPGGDQAAREPRRSAVGVLYEMFGEAVGAMKHLELVRSFPSNHLSVLLRMLAANVNSPRTSSVGRLFDAVAALLGLRQHSEFEGQAAMDLEFALDDSGGNESYTVKLNEPQPSGAVEGQPVSPSPTSTGPWILDWAPMVRELLADLQMGLPAGTISLKVHNSLAESIVLVATKAGLAQVVLSGGCFQNKYLAERAVQRLRQAGVEPYWHRLVPPNDGGIALGQIVAARRAERERGQVCV